LGEYIDEILTSYDAITYDDYTIPTSSATYTFSFSDDDGDSWTVDSDGNEWYYYEDGYTSFYNGTEQTYYWIDSTGDLVYIEYSTSYWWGVDSTTGEQCYMSSDNAYLKCWDSDYVLE
jgi:hypothetical protein